MHAFRSLAVTGLSLLTTLPTLTTAQFSENLDAEPTTITVYAMFDNRRPSPSSSVTPTVTWTGSVISATPSATTYSLAIPPITGGFYVQSDITLVNGPSTYAAWQVYNESSTYGEFCSVLPHPSIADANADPLYDCHVTYLGASGNGGISTTFLETATNTYGMENRTFVGVPAVITAGVEALEGVAPAPPGEDTAVASVTVGGGDGDGDAAAETAASTGEGTAATSTGEGGAVETLTEESAAVGRRGYACGATLLLFWVSLGALIV